MNIKGQSFSPDSTLDDEKIAADANQILSRLGESSTALYVMAQEQHASEDQASIQLKINQT